MRITELGEGGSEDCRELVRVKAKAKRALVGAGARVLFYPTLLYNVLRYKIQAEFRWWDEVDQFLLLGAVPFPKDVPCLRRLGVCGVVTLNEPYETLVPSSLYQAHGIDHLVIPTRDYLFAPSLLDISRGVDFIHRNTSCGRTTYVHCKAGRGRSTTIVLCYLVKYKHMTPAAAFEYVQSRRPRVLLAPSQWQAVQEFSRQNVDHPATESWIPTSPSGDEKVVTEADLEGYGASKDSFKDLCALSHNYFPARPVSSSLMPSSPPGMDVVVVTDADLEGYSMGNTACNDMTVSSYMVVRARPVIGKLSCLFASLKLSSSCPPVASWLLDVRAC